MNQRIDDIEVLRGCAVLFVVVHHASSNLITWSTPALTSFYSYLAAGSASTCFLRCPVSSSRATWCRSCKVRRAAAPRSG